MNTLTKSSPEIVEYIKFITPEESDIPDYFIQLILADNSTFTLKNIRIDTILDNDPGAKEYVLSEEERYDEESEYQPTHEELYHPIVIFNNEVYDGFSRLSHFYHSGEKTIETYTNT